MKESYKVSGKRVAFPESSKGVKLVSRPGGWIVVEHADGTRQRIMAHEARGKLSVSLGGRLWHGDLVREERQSQGGGAGADSDLVAQFPGKVRKILVQEGAIVAAGESLLLVEAMKMEFAIKAPFAGTVTRILVKEAQQLSPGDRFVDLKSEAKKGG